MQSTKNEIRENNNNNKNSDLKTGGRKHSKGGRGGGRRNFLQSDGEDYHPPHSLLPMINIILAHPFTSFQEEEEQRFPSLREWLEGREGLYRSEISSSPSSSCRHHHHHHNPHQDHHQQNVMVRHNCHSIPSRDRRGRLEAVCREEGVREPDL